MDGLHKQTQFILIEIGWKKMLKSSLYIPNTRHNGFEN